MAFHRFPGSSNRTFMELKLDKQQKGIILTDGSNRTFMELKSGGGSLGM